MKKADGILTRAGRTEAAFRIDGLIAVTVDGAAITSDSGPICPTVRGFRLSSGVSIDSGG
jgi:hypothetical protein